MYIFICIQLQTFDQRKLWSKQAHRVIHCCTQIPLEISPPPKIIPPSRIVSVVQVSASFHKILRLVSRLESVRIPLLCQLGSGGRGIVPVFIFCRGNLQGEHFPGDYVMNADTQAPYPLSLSISWCLMKSRSAPPRAPIWL